MQCRGRGVGSRLRRDSVKTGILGWPTCRRIITRKMMVGTIMNRVVHRIFHLESSDGETGERWANAISQNREMISDGLR